MRVGRDAAPAGVVHTTASPGGSWSKPSALWTPVGPGPVEGKLPEMPRWRAGWRDASVQCVGPVGHGSFPQPNTSGRSESNPGHASSRRAIPLAWGEGKREGNTGEPPRPDKDRGRFALAV